MKGRERGRASSVWLKALVFTVSQFSIGKAFTILVELNTNICQIFQTLKSICSATVAATHKRQRFIFWEWNQQGNAVCAVVLMILDDALSPFKVLQWLLIPVTRDLITDGDHKDPLLPLTASPFPSNMPFYTCMSPHWGKSKLLGLLTPHTNPRIVLLECSVYTPPSTIERSCFLLLWSWSYAEWECLWQTYSVPRLDLRKQFLTSPKYIWQLL